VRLSPLGTAATSGLLYKPQMIDEGDCGAIGRITQRKTCPSATLSTTNPTWPDPGSNPDHRCGKPATNFTFTWKAETTGSPRHRSVDNILKKTLCEVVDRIHLFQWQTKKLCSKLYLNRLAVVRFLLTKRSGRTQRSQQRSYWAA
jgi:hypothetical protein